MDKKVSVILPTYNEKENIEEMIRQIYHYIGKNLHEVIVVDDNSPDGTWKIVERLQKKLFKNLKLHRRINKRSLPSSIWDGIKKSEGNIIVWMDCDLSHPPKLIPKMLKYIPNYDIVSASQYVKGGKDKRNFIRIVASKAFSIVAGILLKLKITDVTSGFYAVNRKVFDKIKLMKTGYAEYCIRFIYEAKRKRFKIKEIGYVLVNRKKGTSKTEANLIQFFNNGYLCMKEILRLSLGGKI
jgi:dolichol-phosphate mannosyltransferase